MGRMLLPIPPSEISMSVGNKNQTITLINDGEVNLLKAAGLTDINFTLLIPQIQYPFAKYSSGFIKAKTFLEYFETLKTSMTPFQFIVSRCLPTGKLLFDTNLSVSLEDYKVKESAKNGFDLEVEINLKQYKPFSTKTVTIDVPSETAPVIVEETRPETPVTTPPSSGGGGTYSTIKLTVGRGGSIDGGNCALSTTTAKPKQTVTVLPRARSGYVGDYFTYNGTKKSGSWTITPTGKVATIKVLVYYKKKATTTTKSTTTTTASTVVSAVSSAVSSAVNAVSSLISKIKTATNKTTTTVVKKAATSSVKVTSTAKNKMVAMTK